MQVLLSKMKTIDGLSLYTLYQAMYMGKSDGSFTNFRIYNFEILSSRYERYEDSAIVRNNQLIDSYTIKVFRNPKHRSSVSASDLNVVHFQERLGQDGYWYISYVVFEYTEFDKIFKIIGELDEQKFDID
jgi:hypothetical protein